MFSCAIVLGSIVTRCPSMSLAPSALVQLDSACELFSKAANGFRANKVLVNMFPWIKSLYLEFDVSAQHIMERLQQKAHTSLNDFRKGKGSPIGRHGSSSEPLTPVDENDELATLGGKTRLVAKMEPSSPSQRVLDRSPTSHNPVVPLPLAISTHDQVHPSVVEYLGSFSHHQSGGGSSGYTDAEVDLSPVSPLSAYGMSTAATFHPEAASQYSTQTQTSHLHHMPPPSIHHHGLPTPSPTHTESPMNMHGNGSVSAFPQYFPVYDYGPSAMGTNGINGYASAPMLDNNPMPGQRRASGSPEGNMQSAIWQDFVAGLATQMT